MKKLYYYIPFICFCFLLVFFLKQLFEEQSPSELPSVLLNKKLPLIELEKLEGYSFMPYENLFSNDKPFLINVWSSWCGPCKIEHKNLMKLRNTYKVPIFGINYKDEIENAKNFIENYGNPFSIIGVDRKGKEVINLGVYGIPETFIIDQSGYIKYRHVGPILEYDMLNVILPILKNLEE